MPHSSPSAAALPAIVDPAHAEGAQAAKAARPSYVAIRLRYEYTLENELAARPFERLETFAMLFEPGSDEPAIDSALVRALRAHGGQIAELPPGAGMGRRWRTVDIFNRLVSVLQIDMAPAHPGIQSADFEETALSIIEKHARQAIDECSRFARPVGILRAEDMPGAASITHGLDMAFSELDALEEARVLRSALGKAPDQSSSAKTRHSL